VPSLVRTLLAAETIAFAAAALVHAGVLARGLEHAKAATAEGVIAAVLAAALAWSMADAGAARRAGLAGLGFALLGTLVGLVTIAVGVGPRTRFDLALHAGFLSTLAVGLVLVARAPRAPRHA
jgi:hypothetical protein